MTRGLSIGGRVEPLRFTINSVCLLEETTGQSLADTLSGGVSGLRALVWCGLMRSRPDLTLNEAGDMLDAYLSNGDLDTLCDILSQALEDAGFFHRAKRERTTDRFADSILT